MSESRSRRRLGGLALVSADTRDALAERLASDIAASLAADLDARGKASLVVSGGSTPMTMFKALAQADIDWSRVAVTLADERWVAPGHVHSNETLVRESLLTGRAAAAMFVPLYVDGPEPEPVLDQVDTALRVMAQPFTVVVLGMGDDGHTASLFPDAPELEQGMTERVSLVASARPPSQPLARITLTRAALVDSQRRILHIVGDGKRTRLEEALADEPRLTPIARVLDVRPEEVTIYWAP